MTAKNVIVIGNGIAGISLARHLRKLSNLNITVISNESKHFFARTALMYVYMGDMTFEHTKPYPDQFWKQNRISLLRAEVTSINTEQKTVKLSGDRSLPYDKLVIATGAKPRYMGWQGENLKGVQGFYHKQDLDLLERCAPNNTVCKRAVVVGGGLIGIEVVEMLASRGIAVTFIVREPSFRSNVLPLSESEMISHHIKDYGIDLRLGVNLEKIKADEHGSAHSVIIKETQEEINCDLVCLTLGVTPNIDFLKDSGINIQTGVKVNGYLETNIPDIYAIGNCAEPLDQGENWKFAANWHTARMMGETLARTLSGSRTAYTPSFPFDSAMFLGIEHQSYGRVSARPKFGNSQFNWMEKDGNRSITIEYNAETRLFRGINTFGIRLRHEVLDRWLSEERTFDFVIDNLSEANFDPEFSKPFDKDVLRLYNSTITTSQT